MKLLPSILRQFRFYYCLVPPPGGIACVRTLPVKGTSRLDASPMTSTFLRRTFSSSAPSRAMKITSVQGGCYPHASLSLSEGLTAPVALSEARSDVSSPSRRSPILAGSLPSVSFRTGCTSFRTSRPTRLPSSTLTLRRSSQTRSRSSASRSRISSLRIITM